MKWTDDAVIGMLNSQQQKNKKFKFVKFPSSLTE